MLYTKITKVLPINSVSRKVPNGTLQGTLEPELMDLIVLFRKLSFFSTKTSCPIFDSRLLCNREFRIHVIHAFFYFCFVEGIIILTPGVLNGKSVLLVLAMQTVLQKKKLSTYHNSTYCLSKNTLQIFTIRT